MMPRGDSLFLKIAPPECFLLAQLSVAESSVPDGEKNSTLLVNIDRRKSTNLIGDWYYLPGICGASL